MLLLLPVVPLHAASPARDIPTNLLATLDALAAAVRAGDADAYRALVDDSDPLFVREHDGWIEDWAGPHPVAAFDLHADNIRFDGDTAQLDLTLTWTLPDDPRERQATYPALFRRGTDGVWRYAGEAWVTVEIAHFRVYAFPGMEGYARGLAVLLPSVYKHATQSLQHTPDGITTIKLYADPWALAATTRLSLPPIQGWNEPGESIKLRVEPDHLPHAYTLTHEYTHAVMFDMAGTTIGRWPWWLAEGVAEYVGSRYWPPERTAERMGWVREWAAGGQLVAWDTISDFSTAPQDLWPYVYPQGYAFVRYVTETFGPEQRNVWLESMARDQDLPDATEAVLGLPFEALDRNFRAWLADH
jgi:hypothetical protein